MCGWAGAKLPTRPCAVQALRPAQLPRSQGIGRGLRCLLLLALLALLQQPAPRLSAATAKPVAAARLASWGASWAFLGLDE